MKWGDATLILGVFLGIFHPGVLPGFPAYKQPLFSFSHNNLKDEKKTRN
jgi:hypothetical protein